MIDWLLQGDLAIEYQSRRDLLGEDRKDLQQRMIHEGWGKAFLAKRKTDGVWGQDFYQPKWTSTHYTLLDLRNLNISPQAEAARESILNVLDHYLALDGGIKLGPSTTARSDVCVNGMFLNYAC